MCDLGLFMGWFLICRVLYKNGLSTLSLEILLSYVFLPILAGFRDLLTGWVYKKKKNHLLYPGIVIRTITLIVVLVSYPKLG